jgi:hypothetical protein
VVPSKLPTRVFNPTFLGSFESAWQTLVSNTDFGWASWPLAIAAEGPRGLRSQSRAVRSRSSAARSQSSRGLEDARNCCKGSQSSAVRSTSDLA